MHVMERSSCRETETKKDYLILLLIPSASLDKRILLVIAKL